MLMYGLRLLSLRSWLGGESRLTLGLNFVLELVNPLALVLRFLLVLFPILLRLHDVVHEVIDVLIIHLLVGVVIFGRLLLIFSRLLTLFICTFLLDTSLVCPTIRIKVIFRAILSQAATITLAIRLSLPLMILELYAIIKVLLTSDTPTITALLIRLLLLLLLLLLLVSLSTTTLSI